MVTVKHIAARNIMTGREAGWLHLKLIVTNWSAAMISRLHIRGVRRIFQKGFSPRCGHVSAHFKEPEMVPISYYK